MTERIASTISGLARVVRAVLGVPDYERYFRHVTEKHPGCVPMTRAEFAAERLESRYNKPGSRCC